MAGEQYTITQSGTVELRSSFNKGHYIDFDVTHKLSEDDAKGERVRHVAGIKLNSETDSDTATIKVFCFQHAPPHGDLIFGGREQTES